jgi:hypothetical protein
MHPIPNPYRCVFVVVVIARFIAQHGPIADVPFVGVGGFEQILRHMKHETAAAFVPHDFDWLFEISDRFFPHVAYKQSEVLVLVNQENIHDFLSTVTRRTRIELRRLADLTTARVVACLVNLP